jgi:hypothetical protein
VKLGGGSRGTVAACLYRNGGYRDAHWGLLYLACWLIVSQELRHEATSEEYGKFWNRGDATISRERAHLRACLPEGWTVEVMQGLVWEQSRTWHLGKKVSREAVMGELSDRRIAWL